MSPRPKPKSPKRLALFALDVITSHPVVILLAGLYGVAQPGYWIEPIKAEYGVLMAIAGGAAGLCLRVRRNHCAAGWDFWLLTYATVMLGASTVQLRTGDWVGAAGLFSAAMGATREVKADLEFWKFRKAAQGLNGNTTTR